MAGSPNACQAGMMAYVGPFANTPGMLSRGSPSAFSPCLGAASDFAGMYFRAMLGFAPHAGEMPQSPGCYRVADGQNFSPTDQLRLSK